MILYSVSNIQTETANWARESCLKNIIKNHNGYKFQVLMGRTYCAIMVRGQKKKKKPQKQKKQTYVIFVMRKRKQIAIKNKRKK